MKVIPKVPPGIVLALLLLSQNAPSATADTPVGSDRMRPLGQCSGCVIENHDFNGQRLTGIDLSDAALSNVALDGAQLNLAILEDAVLTRVSFAGANLSGTIFVGARLTDVSFEGANLQGAVFEGAILERTTLDGAHLCNTQTPADALDNSDCERSWEDPGRRSIHHSASPKGDEN